MQTAIPVVLHGSTCWDEERLPVDEFEHRLIQIKSEMRRLGIDGLVVYGDRVDYSLLTYLTHYVPKHSSAILFVPSVGEPTILAKVAGIRDIPSIRALTWVSDVRPANNIKKDVSEFYKKIMNGSHEGPVHIGTVGLERMKQLMYQEVIDCLCTSNFTLRAFDNEFKRLLMRKRPRELSVIREVAGILSSSIHSMKEAMNRGCGVVISVLEAERTARNLGAQDVRILYSLDCGESFEPFITTSEIRNDPLVAYFAVEFRGYWAEGLVSLTNRDRDIDIRASEILRFVEKALTPKKSIRELIQQAQTMVPPYHMHRLVQGGFGHAIGLSLEEEPYLRDNAEDYLVEKNQVYSIHIGLTNGQSENSLMSSLVLVHENHSEILWTSRNKGKS